MNDRAVVSLPMRLIVSIVIGLAVLSAILSFLSNSNLSKPSMVVYVDPILCEVNSSSGLINLSISVSSTTSGRPIKDAIVIVEGLNGFTSALTDSNGRTNISISITFPRYTREGYLDVTVKSPYYSTFHQEDTIRVIQI